MRDINVQVLLYQIGKEPETRWVKNSLEAFQELVGGYIEGHPVTDDPDLQLICYELGRFERKPNRLVRGLDLVHGDFFISQVDKEGETVSLIEEDVARCRRWVSAEPF
jgi:hypothetical protein